MDIVQNMQVFKPLVDTFELDHDLIRWRSRPDDGIITLIGEVGFGRLNISRSPEAVLQSHFDEPFGEVSISGEVKAPGTYPLEPGMRIVIRQVDDSGRSLLNYLYSGDPGDVSEITRAVSPEMM